MRTYLRLFVVVITLASISEPVVCQLPNAERIQAYTVELKTTTVRTLANGTTITDERTEIRASDSQQRTYREYRHSTTPGNGKKVSTFYVEDPVEGAQIRWNSEEQEAIVLRLPPQDQRHGCWRSETGHVSIGYGPSLATSGSKGTASARTAPTTPSGGGGVTGSSVGAEVGMMPARGGNPAAPKSEDLGTATIDGIEVHGYKYASTIPAGQMGNDQPLVTTDEAWVAPSLGFALRQVRDDPQAGKSTTEVVRVDLTEPPTSTFQPPEGYKIVTEEMHQVACAEPGMPGPH